MPTNQFLTFATDVGARVRTYAQWLASSVRGPGYPSGILAKEDLNTAIRQATFVASALSQFVLDQTGMDVPDDGDRAAYEARLLLGVQNVAANLGGAGARYVAASQLLAGGFYLADSTAGTFTLTLPAVTGASRTIIEIQDAAGTWAANPVTLARNGATILGVAEDFELNAAGYGLFVWYDGATWQIS